MLTISPHTKIWDVNIWLTIEIEIEQINNVNNVDLLCIWSHKFQNAIVH